jgi:hypothetical protein
MILLCNLFLIHEKKYFVVRVHSMITDFIYKMPEKIKDLRNRNEEVSRLIDDSYANQTAVGASNPYFQHGGNLQGSLYHHNSFGAQQMLSAANKAANLANENHGFEDFLNLVFIFE